MAKKNNIKWILALVILWAAIGYYQMGKTPVSKQQPMPNPSYGMEKNGAGVALDFTTNANKIHAAVDTGLINANMTAKDLKEIRREVPRQEIEGVIRWHARHILLTLPESITTEALEQTLAPLVAKAGGKIINTEPDNYQGLPVVRFDIGIVDKLEGEPLTLITDRLFIAKDKGALPLPKPRADNRRGDMAIIIDDFGYTKAPIAGFADMGRPITFSVLPYRSYSNEAATRALSAGHLVMLHLPLEPLSAAEEAEPTVITVGMADEDIKQTVAKAIAATPGVQGINNHQGSKATVDHRVMKAVLSVIKAHNLFFIDSRTNGQSVAAATSRQLGIKTGENELFIDNSSDVETIKNQLRKAAEMALKNGSIIVIGHARSSTVVAVREMIPELEAAGIKLVYVNQLLK